MAPLRNNATTNTLLLGWRSCVLGFLLSSVKDKELRGYLQTFEADLILADGSGDTNRIPTQDCGFR